MYKEIKDKIDNFSSKLESLEENQMEILKMRNTITDIDNSVDEFSSRLDAMK